MKTRKIFIIILHFGDITVTQECIKSLLENETAAFEIIVVNNDKQKLFKQTFENAKNITVINNVENVGFAAGVNIGIKYALSKKADYILLLNNDTSIEKPFLQTLTVFLENNKHAGIVGPAIEFHKDGKTIYDLGGNINKLLGRTSHTEVEKIENVQPGQTTYVTGACMMIKKEVFEKAGFFDERFFLYYEDVDFCLRAEEKGFASFVLPSVVITHSLSKTIGKVSKLAIYHQTKSAVLFGSKWCKKSRVLNLLFIFAQSCLFTVKLGKTGLIAFQGMRDGLQMVQ